MWLLSLWPRKTRRPKADPAKIAELERELGLNQPEAVPLKILDVIVYTTAQGEYVPVTPENFLSVVADDAKKVQVTWSGNEGTFETLIKAIRSGPPERGCCGHD